MHRRFLLLVAPILLVTAPWTANDSKNRFRLGFYYGHPTALVEQNTGTDLGPRVTIFDTSGNVQARVSRQPFGDEPGRFYAPHAIAVDSHGDVYVAEVSWAEYGGLRFRLL